MQKKNNAKNNTKKSPKKPTNNSAKKPTTSNKPAKRAKTVHLKSLEGKSKAEKKEIRERHDAAMERLEKAQAKYIGTHKGNGKYAKGQNAAQGKVSKRTERQKRWRGWRESDGESSPVTTYNLNDLKKNDDKDDEK